MILKREYYNVDNFKHRGIRVYKNDKGCIITYLSSHYLIENSNGEFKAVAMENSKVFEPRFLREIHDCMIDLECEDSIENVTYVLLAGLSTIVDRLLDQEEEQTAEDFFRVICKHYNRDITERPNHYSNPISIYREVSKCF